MYRAMRTVEPFTRTASIRLLWPFLSLARAHGHDPSYIAPYLGITEAELEDPDTRVSQQRLCDLLNQAIAKSGVRDLGLVAASYVDSSHFGIAEYIARSRPTLREAVESTVRYLPLLADGAHTALAISGKVARISFWFDASIVVHEAAYEFATAMAVLRARRTTGIAKLSPLEVRFMHPEPPDTTRHRALFGCPVTFGAEATEIVISAKFLNRRMAAPEPVLDALLTRQADRMLEQLPRASGAAEQIEAELAQHFDLRNASTERLARKLGCSVRTLHRRLQEEGTSYRAVLDRVRAAIAMRRLEQSDQPIAQIADALGFASSQSFHRSFKRWTGTTAAEHRRRTHDRGTARAPRSRRRDSK